MAYLTKLHEAASIGNAVSATGNIVLIIADNVYPSRTRGFRRPM